MGIVAAAILEDIGSFAGTSESLVSLPFRHLAVGWFVYGTKPISEGEIEREIEHSGRPAAVSDMAEPLRGGDGRFAGR